ncbi:MAG: D-galactonate dehydratase, partial [Candidatus Latescibacteria bacterium]|nr:D-galactonate dehydratase [Candidatus Latescibacterota bacterium]
VVTESYTVEKTGRIVRPSDAPGLGIEINEEEVAKHPFEQELLQRVFYADGSVGDW